MVHFIVHVKDKTFRVETGEGRQTVQWLGFVGCARYNSTTPPEPRSIRTEHEDWIRPDAILKDTFNEGEHIWVITDDDE
jgi:hypothetical protein